MPRPNERRTVAAPPKKVVVASAKRYRKAEERDAEQGVGIRQWQKALWDYYRVVGEFEYVANWLGDMLSRARLYAAEDGVEVDGGPAAEAVKELFGSRVGKARALRTLGIHSCVTGESYIFASDNGPWQVLSPTVVTSVGGQWQIKGKAVEEKALVIRTWDRDPGDPEEVMSSARAAIPTLNEIVKLSQHIEAQINSRLASAGIMFLPNEMTFSSATDTDGAETKNTSSSDQFVHELYEIATEAIEDRSSPGALVPIVVTADADVIDKVNKVEFWSELDQHVVEMRRDAIRRLGLALNVPPEILSGTGDANHWQTWAVDDASIKSHLEPLLDRLCGDLTEGFLWPALEGVVADPKAFSIKADTALMRVRPNRSEEAIQLFNLGELKASTLRREAGFDEQDKPTDTERREWLKKKIAAMSATPEVSAQMLTLLGIPVESSDDDPKGQVPVGTGDVGAPKAVPSEGERRDLERDAERKAEEASLIAAAEQMVFRALERAGNKAKNRLKVQAPEGTEAPELYLFRSNTDADASFMLDGSFAHVERFAKGLSIRPALLAWTLEEFCRDLIVNGKPYTRSALCEALRVEVPSA